MSGGFLVWAYSFSCLMREVIELSCVASKVANLSESSLPILFDLSPPSLISPLPSLPWFGTSHPTTFPFYSTIRKNGPNASRFRRSRGRRNRPRNGRKWIGSTESSAWKAKTLVLEDGMDDVGVHVFYTLCYGTFHLYHLVAPLCRLSVFPATKSVFFSTLLTLQ